jgi:hypothetical protein
VRLGKSNNEGLETAQNTRKETKRDINMTSSNNNSNNNNKQEIEPTNKNNRNNNK